MTNRDRKHLLILTNGIFLAVIAGCAWLVASPLSIGDPEALSKPGQKGSARLESPEAGPLSSYASIYTRPLRKPLYDPTPQAVVAAAKAEPKFLAVLTGTIVEPGFTFATFKVPNGEEKVIPVGQIIEGAEVLSISQGEVKIRFNAKEITLKASTEGQP